MAEQFTGSFTRLFANAFAEGPTVRLIGSIARQGRIRLQRPLQRLGLAAQIYRERQALAGLSDEALRDIGIDRISAEMEAARGLLDLPANRNP